VPVFVGQAVLPGSRNVAAPGSRHALGKEQPVLWRGQPTLCQVPAHCPHLACKAPVRATTPGTGTSPVAPQQHVIFPRREDPKM